MVAGRYLFILKQKICTRQLADLLLLALQELILGPAILVEAVEQIADLAQQQVFLRQARAPCLAGCEAVGIRSLDALF